MNILKINIIKSITVILTVVFMLFNSSYSNAQTASVQILYNPGLMSSTAVSSGYVVAQSGPVALSGTCTLCAPSSLAQTIADAFSKTVDDALKNAAQNIENSVKDNNKDYLESLLADIKGIEVSVSNAWKQSWYDLMKPALREMLKQINVLMIEEARQLQSFYDATLAIEVRAYEDLLAVQSEEEYRPSMHANIAAAGARGFARAQTFTRAMRKAVPQELLNAGVNKKDVDNLGSRIEYDVARYDKFISKFCDPQSGTANFAEMCQAENEDIYNADIQPNSFIYNRLTLPIDPNTDPEGDVFDALIALRVNLFGSPVASVMPAGLFSSPAGRENFLERRSFLARYGAVMSVHNLIESWRVPGSQMGDWIKSVLEIEDSDIKDWYRNLDNPSYKELIHAMTVDKFNSGRYARDLLSNESNIKMEKLVLTSMQSVLLRDYYELLERTALVLALQVSMLTDGVDIQFNNIRLAPGTEE